MAVYCYEGNAYTSQVGTLKEFGDVWINPNGIFGILSLKKERNDLKTRHNCGLEGVLFVVETNYKIIVFKENDQVLYVHDTTKRELAMVGAVVDNLGKLFQRKCKQDREALQVYGVMAYPLTVNFNNIVHEDMTSN